MTDAPTTESPRIAAVAPGADPLARLHHMSTTAGVTSQEYVAINVPSIMALIFGLNAAWVLVFHQWPLLAIPLAGIAFGFAALRQIRDSNGTQKGKSAAWIGIVLALLMGGGEVGSRFAQGRSQQNNEEGVAQVFQRLGERLKAGDNAGAYALFSERFRNRVTRERFDMQWKIVQTGVSSIEKIDWNGVPMMFQGDGSGRLVGQAMAVFHFSKSAELGRQPVIIREGAEGWEIDDIPALFPESKKR